PFCITQIKYTEKLHKNNPKTNNTLFFERSVSGRDSSLKKTYFFICLLDRGQFIDVELFIFVFI
ncbi:hypothetical protein B9P78_08570, partial [Aerococcus sp. 1KP-2016]